MFIIKYNIPIKKIEINKFVKLKKGTLAINWQLYNFDPETHPFSGDSVSVLFQTAVHNSVAVFPALQVPVITFVIKHWPELKPTDSTHCSKFKFHEHPQLTPDTLPVVQKS